MSLCCVVQAPQAVTEPGYLYLKQCYSRLHTAPLLVMWSGSLLLGHNTHHHGREAGWERDGRAIGTFPEDNGIPFNCVTIFCLVSTMPIICFSILILNYYRDTVAKRSDVSSNRARTLEALRGIVHIVEHQNHNFHNFSAWRFFAKHIQWLNLGACQYGRLSIWPPICFPGVERPWIWPWLQLSHTSGALQHECICSDYV